MKAVVLVCLAACASTTDRIVKPAQQLLDEAKTMTIEDACKSLNDALASGDYSNSRLQADNLSAMNDEYQVGHARETYCRGVERRDSKMKDLSSENDLVTLKAVAISDGEDEGVRRKAAERLLVVLTETKDKDAVAKLTEMNAKSELPQWYLALRIEERIEQKYWELHPVDVAPALKAAVTAVVLAHSQLTKAAVDGDVEAARKAYREREKELCDALTPLENRVAPLQALDPELRTRILSACPK